MYIRGKKIINYYYDNMKDLEKLLNPETPKEEIQALLKENKNLIPLWILANMFNSENNDIDVY